MQELAQEVIAYFQQKPVVVLTTAFIAGLAANKTVAYGGRSTLVLHLLVGLAGFFLGQFVILFFGLIKYLEALPEFRLLFDFIAAYIGSFLIAAVIHVLRPL
jgi:uncharacterized membrane protein YeaQ/YmgE (transglycosylase-associated protein family)